MSLHEHIENEFAELWSPYFLTICRDFNLTEDQRATAIAMTFEAVIEGYIPAKGSVKAFATTVLRRKIIDVLRASSTKKANLLLYSDDSEGTDHSLNPSDACEWKEVADLVDSGMQVLVPPWDQIFRKHFYDRLPLPQLGKEYGIKNSTLYANYHRNLLKLQEFIRKGLGDTNQI